MIVSEEDVLTHLLALLPPPLIFGRIPKCFDTAVWTFLSSSSEPNITYQCQTQSIFGDTVYSCYCKRRLVTPPTLPSRVAEGMEIFDFDNPRSLERHFRKRIPSKIVSTY